MNISTKKNLEIWLKIEGNKPSTNQINEARLWLAEFERTHKAVNTDITRHYNVLFKQNKQVGGCGGCNQALIGQIREYIQVYDEVFKHEKNENTGTVGGVVQKQTGEGKVQPAEAAVEQEQGEKKSNTPKNVGKAVTRPSAKNKKPNNSRKKEVI